MKKPILFIVLLGISLNVKAAEICSEFDDNISARIVMGLSVMGDYQETIQDAGGNDIPNPETRSDFAERMVREFIKRQVSRFEEARDSAVAGKKARDKVNSEIDIR